MSRGQPGYAELSGPLTPEESERIARAFDQCRNSAGFVSRAAGKRILERTGLPDLMLQSIWQLSDLDLDGRLSLREFTCAMHLAEEAKRGQKLPMDVRPEQQAALVRSVEAFVQPLKVGASGAVEPERTDHLDTSHLDGPRRLAAFGDGSFEPPSALRDPVAELMSGVNDTLDNKKLGQLAQVFSAVAKSSAGSDLESYALEVVRERKELEQQLGRRQEDVRQLWEVKAALETLRDEARQVDTGLAGRQRRVAHLKEELDFVQGEVRLAEEDLEELRELDGRHRASASDKDQLWRAMKEVRELRVAMDALLKQKSILQGEMQALVERQRHFDNDRDLMLAGVEAEQAKLTALRSQRMRLRSERAALQQEATEHEAGDQSRYPSYGSYGSYGGYGDHGGALDSSPGSKSFDAWQSGDSIQVPKGAQHPWSVKNREGSSPGSPQGLRGLGLSSGPVPPPSPPPPPSSPPVRRPHQAGRPADSRGVRHPEGSPGSVRQSQSPMLAADEGK